MAFREGGGLVALGLVRNDVVGRRGRVGQHHRRFALGEQPIGLTPARRDGQHAILQLGPGLGGVIAINRLDPEQQAETRRGGARILDHDLLVLVAFHQILEACRRGPQLFRVIDHGEVAVVVRQEGVIAPAARNGDALGRNAMRGEQLAGARFRREIGVEAEHDIGLGVGAFELHAVQQRNAIGHRNEVHVAFAFGLEGLFHDWARTPFGGEAVIGVNGQHLLRGGRQDAERKRAGQQGRQQCVAHAAPPFHPRFREVEALLNKRV